ncbi:MAG TPA: alpha/beta fold hydrolase [Acidimicrobiales bacterium]|nr:alpha/beta fold hydrolase [Acidimicrobiales bacterium]
MATFEQGEIRIEYWEHGSGFPLTLFAPGGMRSEAKLWGETAADPSKRPPWIDPRSDLAGDFRVISMDQRNAGASRAPVRPGDGWKTYTSDHLALLDHLGVDRTHLMGGCIGSSYCLSLIEESPSRVAAAVLQNPIGLTAKNRRAFHEMFDSWAAELRASRDDVTEEALDAMRESFYDGDFVFSVGRDFVAHCPVPLLVLAGNDLYHPREIAEEIASLAPDAELVYDWAGEHDRTRAKVREFLLARTPPA